MRKLKVTAVSYLNTKPLLYGLFEKGMDEYLDLSLDIPSECARKLKTGEVDLGLVPVAIIPELTDPYLISDYCIGADGAVATVCILGECPIEEMTHIYLDHHSRTSIELAKILLREHWKIEPELLPAFPGYENEIKGKVGGVLIGDRVIEREGQFAFSYDLAEVWKAHTGLPFVFATWVSNQPLDSFFIEKFNEALAAGIAHIPQLVLLLPKPHTGFDLQEYFTKHISYELNEGKRRALKLFLEEMGTAIPPSLAKGLALIK